MQHIFRSFGCTTFKTYLYHTYLNIIYLWVGQSLYSYDHMFVFFLGGAQKKSWATFAGSLNHDWLVVSTPLKNMSQNGNLPQGSGWKWKISLKPPPSWATFYRISWSILGCSASRVFRHLFFLFGHANRGRREGAFSLTQFTHILEEQPKRMAQGKSDSKSGHQKKTSYNGFWTISIFHGLTQMYPNYIYIYLSIYLCIYISQLLSGQFIINA